MKVWTSEQANAWYERIPWQVGFNYIPAYAVNTTEMWQSESFNITAIHNELLLASSAGYKSIRLFLPFIVWENERASFLSHFESVLSIASKCGMSVLPVLFDDCAFDNGKDPVLGKQPDPIPGSQLGRWTPCPGFAVADNPEKQPLLREYVHAIVELHRDDPRILAWDMFNEPGNTNRNNESLPLLVNSFRWTRECNPIQPLTSGLWLHDQRNSVTAAMLELSDVVSFHTYTSLDTTKEFVDYLSEQKKPLFVTEWLCRTGNNTFFTHLPFFAHNKISCWNWGCVVGRTQAHLQYFVNSDPAPKVWKQDVFNPDGSPYDPEEIELIARLKAESFQT